MASNTVTQGLKFFKTVILRSNILYIVRKDANF